MTRLKSLFLLGSPDFDGIGLLHEEIHKRDLGSVDVIDAIRVGAYPAIQNFNIYTLVLWKWLRRRQFKSSVQSKLDVWYELPSLHETFCQTQKCILDDSVLTNLVIEIIKDDVVASGLDPEKQRLIIENRAPKVRRQVEYIIRYLTSQINLNTYRDVVVFNGRNPVARILRELKMFYEFEYIMVEYWGSRSGRQTYLAADFDLFDLDLRSDFILDKYNSTTSDDKIINAQLSIEERLNKGMDPLMRSWGIREYSANEKSADSDRKIISFFFSSEDEYPAFRKSRYGFPNPTEQYKIFSELTHELVKLQNENDFDIFIKLHPRYLKEKKLSNALIYWNKSFRKAREQGLKFTVLSPTENPYPLIKNSDVVFAFGTISIEASILGVPSVCLGPNPFSTHRCTHFAYCIEDIISYVKCPPELIDVEFAYPYMWAWRELGAVPSSFKQKELLASFSRFKISSPFKNRFIQQGETK